MSSCKFFLSPISLTFLNSLVSCANFNILPVTPSSKSLMYTKNMRGHPELSSFSQEYTEYAGGGKGVIGRSTLLENVDYDALHFHTGLLKINIYKVLLRE